MKILLPLILTGTIIVFTRCVKSGINPDRVHCDNLLTDTAGTNENGRIYMPNAFTPNGDGLNEVIRPTTQNISSFVFSVFDEDDTQLFSTNVAGQGWASNPTINSSTSEKYYFKVQATTFSGRHIGICGDLYKVSCRPAGVTLVFEDQLAPGGFIGPSAEVLPSCP